MKVTKLDIQHSKMDIRNGSDILLINKTNGDIVGEGEGPYYERDVERYVVKKIDGKLYLIKDRYIDLFK